MTWYLLSSGVHDPIGSAARGPVVVAFLVFIGLALLWVVTLATHDDHPEGLYVADRSLSPVFNGFAMAGEQISVLTLFATSGAIALFGYDGYASAVDSVLALGLLLLLAQKVRNSGRYTLGGLFSLRASGPAPCIAAAVVTLAITLPMLVIQLRAGGIIAAMLIGLSTDAAQVLCTVLLGGLVVCFAVVADLKGTSRMHVVKVGITLVTLAVFVVLSLNKFSWDAGSLLSAAVDKSVAPDDYLSPGLWAHISSLVPLNMISDHIVVILGTAVMPHLILRVGASRTGRSARRSMSIAVGLTGAYFLLLIATGFAAAAVVGGRDIGRVDDNGQASPVLLASDVLGNGSAMRVALITAVACAAFLVILTTVTSVMFAAAVTLAHDVFARADGPRATRRHVRALRLAIVVLGAMGLTLSAAAHRYSVEFLAIFSMSVAATCVAPVLVYSFFWPGFNRRGLLWSVYGGLLLCTVLTMFSPTVSGSAYALMPEADFHWYPFRAPGLLSVPAAFLLGWLGSRNPVRGPVRAERPVEQGVI
ncbi:sodium:solute symporter family transporter [Streptomyces ochraceiscleroticus]|uniref:Transporter n=1 Tax=Streptomyces ochraceiscleroticus TaxID=47761 RepID=A0ABW1MLQ6_9ACTN|nr:transporter [Streptomyces ochraceiscleroticus]